MSNFEPKQVRPPKLNSKPLQKPQTLKFCSAKKQIEARPPKYEKNWIFELLLMHGNIHLLKSNCKPRIRTLNQKLRTHKITLKLNPTLTDYSNRCCWYTHDDIRVVNWATKPLILIMHIVLYCWWWPLKKQK